MLDTAEIKAIKLSVSIQREGVKPSRQECFFALIHILEDLSNAALYAESGSAFPGTIPDKWTIELVSIYKRLDAIYDELIRYGVRRFGWRRMAGAIDDPAGTLGDMLPPYASEEDFITPNWK